MLNYKQQKELYDKWYSSLPNKKKHFMDSYNERATTVSEFRKKKSALHKPLHRRQYTHLTSNTKNAKREPMATPNKQVENEK